MPSWRGLPSSLAALPSPVVSNRKRGLGTPQKAENSMSPSHNLHRSLKAGLVAVGLSALAGLPAQAGPYSGGYVGTAYNSTAVEGWATVVDSYNPGPDQIGSDPTTPTFNDTTQALGQANAINTQNSGDVVSLGDGGSIILSFASPIVNGPGADFSVFENGFESYPGSGVGFLELATVSVSSNGINYFTFPDVSLTPTTSQVGSFGYLDPTNLYDLAGKTFAGTGTDFDLQELAGISPLLLNLNDIQYVKITDVVGEDSAPYGTKDSLGNYINDPFPTDFPSSGFDLDAVAVLNNQANASPEPTTLVLLLGGLLATVAVFRLRRFVPTAAILVAVPALGFADTTVNFTSLTPSTSYTGPGGGDYTNDTSFTVGGLGFNNSYDPTYDSWAGFAYSDTHDETTPDYTNEYSAEVSGFNSATSCPYLRGGVRLRWLFLSDHLVPGGGTAHRRVGHQHGLCLPSHQEWKFVLTAFQPRLLLHLGHHGLQRAKHNHGLRGLQSGQLPGRGHAV